MNFSNLMIIKALVSLVFGILLLSIPYQLLSIFGAVLSDGGIYTAREYSAALLGIFLLCWFTKNEGESAARRSIILALFVYDLIGLLVTSMTIVAGVLNPLGWFIAFIYLFFTIGYGYFMVRHRCPEEPEKFYHQEQAAPITGAASFTRLRTKNQQLNS